MTVHENVILDLLPAVRAGHASAESRSLVEEYLHTNPKLATYAALMPTPDPELELRTLKRTRAEVGRHGWNKGMAIFFTLLPLSFVIDEQTGFRFLFGNYPGLIVGMAVCATAFWMRDFLYNRRWSAPK
jgi:hypothetical protein